MIMFNQSISRNTSNHFVSKRQSRMEESFMFTQSILKRLHNLSAPRTLGVLLCFFSFNAYAQDVSAEAQQESPEGSKESSAQLEEIVVTAQKREQNINDVGISIVTATAEQLQSAGVFDIMSLAKVVSGFTASRTQTGYQVFSIRGVNFNAQQIHAPPTVSTYVDEAALPYPSMTGGLLLDVDHVEILKGPQGTLFGQNATGGSVNVIAAKPTNHFAAKIQQHVNHFGESMTDGYISGPFSDTLRARFAFTTTHGGSWQKGYFANDNENGSQNKTAARLLLDWTPNDRLKLSFNFNGSVDKNEPPVFQLAKVAPQNPAGAAPGLLTYPLPPENNRAADYNSPQQLDSYLYQGVVRADFKLNDDTTLTSITNVIKNRHDQIQDNDATALNISTAQHIANAKSVNQEIRITGHPISSVNYIVGANYQHDDFDSEDLIALIQYSSLPNTTLNTHFDQGNEAYAVFANLDWNVRDDLTLTAGARYTESKQTESGCSSDTGDGSLNGFLGFLSNLFRGFQGLPPTNAFDGAACATMDSAPGPDGLVSWLPTLVDVTQKEDNVSWRLGANYKPTPDTLLYLLASRGYKSGVFPFQDTIVTGQVIPVKQEELTAFEGGFKGEFFDRKLSFNTSVFYYDYRDKQFYSFVNIIILGQAPTLVNIPKSDAAGVDLDLIMRPLPGLTARAGISYVDSEIGDYLGAPLAGPPVELKGKSFNFAPKWSGAFDVEYRFPVGAKAEMFVGGNALYNSKTYSDLANSADALIPGYTIVDARVGVASETGWSGSLWVRNLANKYYWTTVGVDADSLFKFAGIPRTYGVSVSYQF